jgi:hypothetical protein
MLSLVEAFIVFFSRISFGDWLLFVFQKAACPPGLVTEKVACSLLTSVV